MIAFKIRLKKQKKKMETNRTNLFDYDLKSTSFENLAEIEKFDVDVYKWKKEAGQ